MGRFTKIPQNTFQGLQLDAGVLLTKFDPATETFNDDDIVCATTGGITASCVGTYSDMGEDIDNCPVNMKELKHLDSWETKLSFTSLSTSPQSIRLALGAADIDAVSGAIVPRRSLKQTDFSDSIWWVGDRADGGRVAVCLKNALSTSGFSLQTSKNGKGQISIELTGHVSINDQDTMPMEFYSADPLVDPDIEYEITAAATIQNGSVAFTVGGISANKAKAGQTVTVTATPDSGYTGGTITVEDEAGESVTVTGSTFVMPASKVTVSAAFTAE